MERRSARLGQRQTLGAEGIIWGADTLVSLIRSDEMTNLVHDALHLREPEDREEQGKPITDV